MSRVRLLGVDFDDVDVPAAVQLILARPAHARFCYVVTPNADHIMRINRHPIISGLYRAAWLCTLDSKLISLCAQMLHLAAPPLATGTDITSLLLDRMGSHNVAVIGMAAAEIRVLRIKYPLLNFIHHAPPENLLNNPAAFEAATEFAMRSYAGIIFIALGSPLQEMLAAAIAARPEATGTGLCIGSALAFCAGRQARAPMWMRRAGLEWLHRLLNDPKRLAHRYLLDDPPIFGLLWREYRARRR